MKKLSAIAIAAIYLVAFQAKATITINMSVADLQDQNGNITPSPAIAILVSDTSGLGFNGGVTNLAANSSLALGSNLTIQGGGVGDLIIGKWQISAGSATPGALGDTTGSILVNPPNAVPLTTGQNLYLMWFATLTLSSTSPGFNTHYGAHQASVAESAFNGGQPWLVPADGANVNLSSLTPNEGGITPVTELQEHFLTQVPEPSTMALVGLGLLGMLGFARRRS